MTEQNILNCSFQSWYKNYEKITIKSAILKAPPSFVQYLLCDESVFLPDHSVESETRTSSSQPAIHDHRDRSSGAASTTSRLLSCEEFKDFEVYAKQIIKELGGKVFPKLNWSSPKDASWVAFNSSLCCQNFSDICLLMKSSNFITHDLSEPFKACSNSNTDSLPAVEYVLVLREWVDLAPSGEFRCFVKEGLLIAISQRRNQFFPFIQKDRLSIVERTKAFYEKYIMNKFPDKSVCFDLHMTSNKILLIDFNPFNHITDGLLFTWAELSGEEPLDSKSEEVVHGVTFRAVPAEGSLISSDEMRTYSYPLDVQHLASGEDANKLVDFLKLQKQPTSTSSDSD